MKTELGLHQTSNSYRVGEVHGFWTGFSIYTGQQHNLQGCPAETKMRCTREPPTLGLQTVCACRQSVSLIHRPHSMLGQCGNLHQGQFLESVFEAGIKKLWIGKQIIIKTRALTTVAIIHR